MNQPVTTPANTTYVTHEELQKMRELWQEAMEAMLDGLHSLGLNPNTNLHIDGLIKNATFDSLS
jgi:hypothetical protein